MTQRTEKQIIEKTIGKIDAEIASKRAELQRMQSGWCEDRFQTIKMTNEIGAMQRERTLMAQRLKDLRSVEEMGSRPSGNVFSGSHY